MPDSLTTCFPQILVPALMVTAEKDIVLRPEMSKNMENWVRHDLAQWGIRVSLKENTDAQRKDMPVRVEGAVR